MGILIPGEFAIIRPSTRARSRLKRYAEVAELVDAHDSGSCIRKNVEVRVFSSAPVLTSITNGFTVYGSFRPVITG